MIVRLAHELIAGDRVNFNASERTVGSAGPLPDDDSGRILIVWKGDPLTVGGTSIVDRYMAFALQAA